MKGIDMNLTPLQDLPISPPETGSGSSPGLGGFAELIDAMLATLAHSNAPTGGGAAGPPGEEPEGAGSQSMGDTRPSPDAADESAKGPETVPALPSTDRPRADSSQQEVPPGNRGHAPHTSGARSARAGDLLLAAVQATVEAAPRQVAPPQATDVTSLEPTHPFSAALATVTTASSASERGGSMAVPTRPSPPAVQQAPPVPSTSPPLETGDPSAEQGEAPMHAGPFTTGRPGPPIAAVPSAGDPAVRPGHGVPTMRSQPVESGGETVEASDPELPPTPESRDAEPASSVRPSAGQVDSTIARPDSAPSVDRAAAARVVERLQEWMDSTGRVAKNETVSIELPDPDGDLLVRLAMRDGRVEMNVTRAGSDAPAWLIDQLDEALTRHGFDLTREEERGQPPEEDDPRPDGRQRRTRRARRHDDGLWM